MTITESPRFLVKKHGDSFAAVTYFRLKTALFFALICWVLLVISSLFVSAFA